MDRLFFLLFLLCHTFGLTAQIPSSCIPTAGLLDAYKHDINYLAFVRMQATQHPDRIFVEIPAIHKDSVAATLATVFNLAGQAQADSVFYYRCMHTRFFSNNFTAKIDTSYGYTQAWRNNQTLTGNNIIDSFLQKYSLQLNNYSANSNIANFVTSSPTFPLNMKALADSFDQFPCVEYTNTELTQFFHANEIFYQRDASGSKLDFWLKWGDCMAGCTSVKIWSYEMDHTCHVVSHHDTIISDVDPYPGLINCYLSPLGLMNPSVSYQALVFPNPSTDRLSIANLPEGQPYTYTIYSITGVPLSNGLVRTNGWISTDRLPSGAYSIMLLAEHAQPMRGRFMKL